MKGNRFILFLMLLLSVGPLCSQESAAPDSVVVLGLVVNRISGEHEPFCQVHFLQGSDTVATAVCDQEGYFGVDRLPVGTYSLSVSLRGMTLYQSTTHVSGTLCTATGASGMDLRAMLRPAAAATPTTPRER